MAGVIGEGEGERGRREKMRGIGVRGEGKKSYDLKYLLDEQKSGGSVLTSGHLV